MICAEEVVDAVAGRDGGLGFLETRWRVSIELPSVLVLGLD